ncbi:MAG: phosphotransferase enzyme family protein [Eubacterium sp.]
MSSIYDVIANFKFDGELVSCKEFGSGHINKTYLAAYNDKGIEKKYVVQQVNDSVFKNIDELMENVFSVTSYLRSVIKKNGGDSERETLHFIKTKDDKKYYTADDGSFYRSYVYVKDSICYNTVESAELFKSSGTAFGRFQKLLADFDASTLSETIPHFHNTKWRYDNEFIPSVENDIKGRAALCADEIDFVKNRAADTSVLVNLTEKGCLPLRVTHNDTKLNNVMFDENTNECICVIDLDTVMPGLALYDFGDSIRFGANTAEEDESNLSKVSINLDYFKAYAEGFLAEAGNSFNQCEIDNLAFASKLMTLECGMRFLTDYLNGDTYFRIDYPEHNLVRARNQFKLVADMELHMDEMNEIIKALAE